MNPIHTPTAARPQPAPPQRWFDQRRFRRAFAQHLSRPAFAAIALGLGTVAALADGYYSNDLTPAGTSSGKLHGTSGGRQVGAAISTNGYAHAVLLSGNALASVDLHPAGYYYSMALCADDSQQGGWGYSVGGMHALVWNGSSSSYADLNPSGYMFSSCLGVHQGEQVGYAQNQSYFVTASHAMLWHGSADTAVDLHPVGTYPFSRALGCRDGEQVGYVSTVAYPEGDVAGYHTTSRAVRWNGSSASAVHLHPVGYEASEALCTSGTQQGGWGYLALGTNHLHALLWSGDAGSVVDLHPAGYTDTKVTAINGTVQVGEGWVGPAYAYGSVRHALAWTGSAESVIDLNQYLPPGYTNAVATGIDADGTIVGYAYNGMVNGSTIPAGAIAVVFAPGAAPVAGLASLTLSPGNIVPGGDITVQVGLGGPAPAGGVSISFLSVNPALLATPASVVIPEGESTASFTTTTGGTTLTAPATVKLYATDGAASRAAALTLTPLVKVNTLAANTVEGGFQSVGSITLNIPAQAGGAAVNLSNGGSPLVSVPAVVTVPQGYTTWSFVVNTAPVDTITTVPLTASLGGLGANGSITLSPAPVISVSAVSAPEVVGGQPVTVTVSLNNFPRAAAGAVINLSVGDEATLQLPATVTVPYGTYSTRITGTTTVVPGRKGVTVRASYNGSSVSTTVFVNPIPTVTILQADYLLDTKMFKVQASTTFTNAILTYGGSPDEAPIGTMQFEQGVFKGSILLETAPTQATVWNSLGGSATVPVTIKTGLGGNSTGGGGGGGGGGGSTSTSTTYKLVVKTIGKGTVSSNPGGSSFAPGTQVTLTATPDAGSLWKGWTGSITSSSRTITVTMDGAKTLEANFK